jgi:hypothetical protein
MGSMGKVAYAYDNALMESFWGSMQIELLDRRYWTTRAELARAMFEWVEAFNPVRRHSAPRLPVTGRVRTPSQDRQPGGMITTPKPSGEPVIGHALLHSVHDQPDADSRSLHFPRRSGARSCPTTPTRGSTARSGRRTDVVGIFPKPPSHHPTRRSSPGRAARRMGRRTPLPRPRHHHPSPSHHQRAGGDRPPTSKPSAAEPNEGSEGVHHLKNLTTTRRLSRRDWTWSGPNRSVTSAAGTGANLAMWRSTSCSLGPSSARSA